MIMKCHCFWLMSGFMVLKVLALRAKKIHFESENVHIVALKNSIWEGELLVLWLPISFYGDTVILYFRKGQF